MRNGVRSQGAVIAHGPLNGICDGFRERAFLGCLPPPQPSPRGRGILRCPLSQGERDRVRANTP